MEIISILAVGIVTIFIVFIPLVLELRHFPKVEDFHDVLLWLIPYFLLKSILYLILCFAGYSLYIALRGNEIGSSTDVLIEATNYRNEGIATFLAIATPMLCGIIIKIIGGRIAGIRSKYFYLYDIPTNLIVSTVVFYGFRLLKFVLDSNVF